MGEVTNVVRKRGGFRKEEGSWYFTTRQGRRNAVIIAARGSIAMD